MFLWATSQPTATHTLMELWAARALPSKIGMPINVMGLWSGDNLKHQNTLNHLQKEAGLPIYYLTTPPTKRWWQCTGSAVQPRLSKVTNRNKCTLTV